MQTPMYRHQQLCIVMFGSLVDCLHAACLFSCSRCDSGSLCKLGPACTRLRPSGNRSQSPDPAQSLMYKKPWVVLHCVLSWSIFRPGQSGQLAVAMCLPCIRPATCFLLAPCLLLVSITQDFFGDGLDINDLDLPGQDRPSLVYGALHAPDLLLSVMSSPHADAIAAWLPLTDALTAGIKAFAAEQERWGADAAKAAFPDLQAAAGGAAARGGLALAVLPGGSDAARQQREQVMWQLHGFVTTGQKLVQFWQLKGDGSGSGSGAELLDWLGEQLPPLVRVEDGRRVRLAEDGLDVAGGPIAGQSRSAVAATVVQATAAAGVEGLDGAAATAGVRPPWGKDVKSEAVIEFLRNAALRSAALCALHLIDMLLRGAPQSLRTIARRAADRPRERAAIPYGLNPNVALNPDGTLGPQGPQGCMLTTSQPVDAALLRDGFEPRELLRELLSGGVLEVLDRALRTATVALRASDADLSWAVQGGSQQVGPGGRGDSCKQCLCAFWLSASSYSVDLSYATPVSIQSP